MKPLPGHSIDPAPSPTPRSVDGKVYLARMMGSRNHTVQELHAPHRFEVIYTGPGPFPTDDPRCGDLIATVYDEPTGLRVERPA